MPRRSRRDAVAERAAQRLAEQANRRREAAQRGAQTRRLSRQQQRSEAQRRTEANRRPQAPTTRPSTPLGTSRSRQRAHAEMLTVALRGHFAERMRELAEAHGMSLSKLLRDALLVYTAQVDSGYQPGASLEAWTAQ